MPRPPVSKLDYARLAYDNAFKDVVSQIRARMRRRPDSGTEEMENAIKYLPESLDFWAQQNSVRQDFPDSQWGEYAAIDWTDSKNKVKIWADAQSVLNNEEKEMMASWKRTA